MPSLALLLCDSVLFGAGGTYPVSWETLIHLIPILQTSPSCPSSLPWIPLHSGLIQKASGAKGTVLFAIRLAEPCIVEMGGGLGECSFPDGQPVKSGGFPLSRTGVPLHLCQCSGKKRVGTFCKILIFCLFETTVLVLFLYLLKFAHGKYPYS